MSSTVEILRSSLALVASREALITPYFYETLFSRYPQVRPLFGRHSSQQQAEMLQSALVAVVDHADDPAWVSETLLALGARHKGYGVTDEMYDWVGECLLHTLEHYAGEAWTPEVAKAWTDTYVALAGLARQGAQQAA